MLIFKMYMGFYENYFYVIVQIVFNQSFLTQYPVFLIGTNCLLIQMFQSFFYSFCYLLELRRTSTTFRPRLVHWQEI